VPVVSVSGRETNGHASRHPRSLSLSFSISDDCWPNSILPPGVGLNRAGLATTLRKGREAPPSACLPLTLTTLKFRPVDRGDLYIWE
jgi:hypothetical protein